MLPRISKETVSSLYADLMGDDETLNPTSLYNEMKSSNPQLAKAISGMSGNDVQVAGNMIYLCELIRRQIEADELSETLNA